MQENKEEDVPQRNKIDVVLASWDLNLSTNTECPNEKVTPI